nr:hypothetical protein [Tanacetum cinerariifolium]
MFNNNVIEEVVNAAQVSTATVTITTKKITLAQALKALKTSNLKDKGKGIMIEEPLKPKKDQFKLDEKAALKLQVEFDEEERLARERTKKEHEANIALLKHVMIYRQRLMLIINWVKECKHKNKKRYKLKDLKLKEFDRIQEMFNKVNIFKDFRPELVEGKEKRAGEELEQEITKKQKVEDDKEKAELKQLMETIPYEEKVAIDAIPLAVKSPRIVDWKIHKEKKKSYYQILRADGKSQMYIIFSQMLKIFNKEDLEDLYKLVKARYRSTRPVENLDYLLWSDMKIMFKPHVEDEIYMLVEKKCPLTPPILSMMLEKKLQIDNESEMAYQLCKLIKK